MKQHLLILLALLASLALYSGGARAQTTDVNGNPVDLESIRVSWDLSTKEFEVNVGETVPITRLRVATRHTTFDDPLYPNGALLLVPGVEVVFTVNNGATISDGTTTSSSSLTITSDSNGYALLSNWTVGPEPGDYFLTATFTGSTNLNATDTLTATALDPDDPADPDDPDDPADPAPQQPLRDMTTDTTLGGIGGINNNIRRHLEQLRRRQPE